LLSDVIFVDVDVISKSIKVSAEHQWGVHERARVNKLSFLSDRHFLDVEYEASIEDLLSKGTLSSEDDDFIISDLIRKTHVSRDPSSLVQGWTLNFLPHILRDIVAFNSVNDVLLINPSSKSKNVVILERGESNSRSGYAETINLLPLVFLDVIDLTKAIDLTVDKGSNHINEALNSTE